MFRDWLCWLFCAKNLAKIEKLNDELAQCKREALANERIWSAELVNVERTLHETVKELNELKASLIKKNR